MYAGAFCGKCFNRTYFKRIIFIVIYLRNILLINR